MKLSQISKIPLNIDNLVLFNFFILVFFGFLGTNLPFQERTVDVYEQEVSNINNQILYLFLFFSSLFVFVKRYITIISFLRKEIYLSLFVLLCIVSLFWSDYPDLSIKRSFQILVNFLVVVNGFLFIQPAKLLKGLKIIISLYLFVNFFSSLTIHAAIDPDFGTWRGIEGQKNGLAQNGLFCLLLSSLFFKKDDDLITKSYNYLISLMAIILIVMAGSSTVLLLLIFIFMLSVIPLIEKIFQPVGIGKYFKGLLFFFALSLLLTLAIYSTELFALIPAMFGKDLTISGRTPFWGFLFTEYMKKPLLGYGYGTFWIMGNNPIIDAFASEFGGFRINSAHNGYLEILLQLGAVGLILLILTIIVLVYRSIKLGNNLSLLILLSILVINISEATLFRIKTTSTLVFISLYIAISYYYFRQKNYLS